MNHNESTKFKLLWKSQNITKETFDGVLKQLDEEIRYKSTVILPASKGRYTKKILKDIQDLREYKSGLEKKYSKWNKTYDEDRMPRAQREVMTPGILGTEDTSEKTYGLQTERFNLSQNVKKSLPPGFMSGDKKTDLKNLYVKVFGTDNGLHIDKMNDEEVDKAIHSLKHIFD